MSDKKYYDWFKLGSNLDDVELYRTIKQIAHKSFKKPVIFDIGCGQGMVSDYLKGVGFDVNKYAIKLAKKNYKSNKYYNIDALDINIKNLKLNRANLVVCLNMIEHLKDKDREMFLKKVLPSITKKDSYVIFSLYRQYYLPNLLNTLIRRKSLFDPTHVHNWSIKSFKREISKYFRIVRCKNVAGFTVLTWLTKHIKTETLIVAKFK